MTVSAYFSHEVFHELKEHPQLYNVTITHFSSMNFHCILCHSSEFIFVKLCCPRVVLLLCISSLAIMLSKKM